MSEETLLIIFIGLVALALVVIAASVAFVALEAVQLMRQATELVERVRAAEAVLEEDARELYKSIEREGLKVQTLFDLVVGGFLRRSRRRRSAKE